MADPVEIATFDNGPLRVSGDVILKDGQGKTFDLSGRPAISLCRCGHSSKKPFCDGSHKTAGFESSVKAE